MPVGMGAGKELCVCACVCGEGGAAQTLTLRGARGDRAAPAGGCRCRGPTAPGAREDGAPVTALRRRPGAPSSADPSRPQGAREPGAANPPSDGEF